MDLVYRLPPKDQILDYLHHLYDQNGEIPPSEIPPSEIPPSEIQFWRHLMAYRQAVNDDSDSAIIVEDYVDLVENFDNRIDDLVDELDGEVLLLTHFVYDWSNVQYLRVSESGQSICSVSNEVSGSFCYWISRARMDRLLLLHDRPLRYNPPIVREVSTLTRSGKCEMLEIPLGYRKDTPEYQNYFRGYGLVE